MRPVGFFSEKINYHNHTITIQIKNLNSASHRERRFTLQFFFFQQCYSHTHTHTHSGLKTTRVYPELGLAMLFHDSTAVQNVFVYTFLYLDYWLQGKSCKFHSTYFHRFITSSSCIYSLYLSSTQRLLSLVTDAQFFIL